VVTCFLGASENAAGLAIIYLIIFVVAVCLAIAWIIFPFIEVHELLKVARGLADDFDDARKRLNAVAEKIESCHRALNETNRALQWIVDEKGKER